MRSVLTCIISLLFFGFSHQQDSYDMLPLNHIQVIGSHNSYKKAIDPEVFEFIKKENPSSAKSLDYSHVSIKEQLDLGLLNLELDVNADSKGGTYSEPFGLGLLKNHEPSGEYDPEGLMDEPGFKTFHVQGIDFRSECYTFKDCLMELKMWSDAHEGHLPVFVTINAKDATPSWPGAVVPEKFTSRIFDQLDEDILSTLGRQKLLIPEDIKGENSSLESAVLNEGWPLVKAVRGKFIFILDERDQKRAAYIDGHPSLEGRIMFVNAATGTPEAAILIMNGAKKQLSEIKRMVSKGYIVRTRADANTIEARNNDFSRFEAAKKSGAQIITTDYYYPSSHFRSDYKIEFKGGKYIRKNPLFTQK